MKLLRLAALGAGIAAVVAFAGVGRPDRAQGGGRTTTQADDSITVTGNGVVSAIPTQAQFTFGVTTQGTTAEDALTANAAEMRKVIDALETAGIPSSQIQTSSVSVSPDTSSDGRTIVGYEVSNSVTATIGSISRAGKIVDTAVSAGANQVDGPNLTIADQTTLYQKALTAAVTDARAKAQVLAAASGLTLGAAQSVEEQTSSSPVPVGAELSVAPSTPIEAGTQQVTASVTVVFAAS
jgi:uncharacterized protein